MPKKILRRPVVRTQKSASIRGARGESAAAAAPGSLRVRDVAARCGVEQKTVHNWVARGMIPHFRTPGRHLRFLPDEVAEFVAKGRSKGGEGEPIAPIVGGGTMNVVVVVFGGRGSEQRIRGELASLRRALPKSRIVWLGEKSASFFPPPDVERVATAAELRGLLTNTTPPRRREANGPARVARAARRRSSRPRDGHRRDPERR